MIICTNLPVPIMDHLPFCFTMRKAAKKPSAVRGSRTNHVFAELNLFTEKTAVYHKGLKSYQLSTARAEFKTQPLVSKKVQIGMSFYLDTSPH
jgi:hypothetical protein